jgi:hypothetical protein
MDRALRLPQIFKRTELPREEEPFRDSIFRVELEKLEYRFATLLSLYRDLEEDKEKLLTYVHRRRPE